MSDILAVLQKPDWWFSTILVAIICNVISNYIYDWLKPRMVGRWIGILRFLYTLLVFGTVITCSLIMPMSASNRYTIISTFTLGFGFFLLDLIGFTESSEIGKVLFAQSVTVVALCSLMLFDPSLSTAWETRDSVWFATQLFAAIMTSLAISFIINIIFLRRHVRKRRGLK